MDVSVAGCKVAYDPPVQSSGVHNLVVEGYINANGEPINIKLSRTRSITRGDTASSIKETSAHVVIEDNQNNVYALSETADGNYSGTYTLNPDYEYRIHITTKDNKEYISDFVPCKKAPPIDRLDWKLKDGNVQIFISTHDAANQTTYYRWDYTETWEFHSEYFSTLKFNPKDSTIIPRTVQVYVCYKTKNSSNIFLGSSAKLENDVIDEAPLAQIPAHDRRISILYSTLITQYALDSNAYNYWMAMKNNTEDIGSVFGKQPNQTVGNIHSVTDPSETVVGYIAAGSTVNKRLFINNSSLPRNWNEQRNCTYYDVPNSMDSIMAYFGSGALIPVIKDSVMVVRNGHVQVIIKGYYGGSATCTDCTLTGTPVKPDFWP